MANFLDLSYPQYFADIKYHLNDIPEVHTFKGTWNSLKVKLTSEVVFVLGILLYSNSLKSKLICRI